MEASKLTVVGAHAPMRWGLSNRAYRRLLSDGFHDQISGRCGMSSLKYCPTRSRTRGLVSVSILLTCLNIPMRRNRAKVLLVWTSDRPSASATCCCVYYDGEDD